MNEQVRKLFPNASISFYDANPGLCAPERKRDSGPTLDNQAQRKEKSDDRPSVRIIMFRVRLLDKENAYGATKCLTDCLHQIGLIPGDSLKDIDLEVGQEKVDHYHQERTEVKIYGP